MPIENDQSRTSPPIPHRYQGRLINTDDVLRAIEQYFQECDERGMSYTLAGLGYWLGVADQNLVHGKWNSRCKTVDPAQTVRLFSRPAIQEALRLARVRVEAQRASQLLDKDCNVSAVIFDLKASFGWVDKQALQLTNPDGNLGSKIAVVLPANPDNVTMEQWKRWYDEFAANKKPIDLEDDLIALD